MCYRAFQTSQEDISWVPVCVSACVRACVRVSSLLGVALGSLSTDLWECNCADTTKQCCSSEPGSGCLQHHAAPADLAWQYRRSLLHTAVPLCAPCASMDPPAVCRQTCWGMACVVQSSSCCMVMLLPLGEACALLGLVHFLLYLAVISRT